uniref:Uncharacterized protein n=1 Tax=Arundo donax TaxID=35708 RepID=A0A0A8ZXJ0_ARUDO
MIRLEISCQGPVLTRLPGALRRARFG